MPGMCIGRLARATCQFRSRCPRWKPRRWRSATSARASRERTCWAAFCWPALRPNATATSPWGRWASAACRASPTATALWWSRATRASALHTSRLSTPASVGASTYSTSSPRPIRASRFVSRFGQRISRSFERKPSDYSRTCVRARRSTSSFPRWVRASGMGFFWTKRARAGPRSWAACRIRLT